MLTGAENEDLSLIMYVIVLEPTQTMWSQYFNVTDRRTDRRGIYHGNTGVESCGNKCSPQPDAFSQ